MGFWSFYFLAKLGLHLAGLIDLNWWLNLPFAAALLWWPPPRWRRARQVLAVLIADPRVIGVTVVEANPDHDPDGTSLRRLVAALARAISPA
jgi:hypothetical protein